MGRAVVNYYFCTACGQTRPKEEVVLREDGFLECGLTLPGGECKGALVPMIEEVSVPDHYYKGSDRFRDRTEF